MPPLSDFHNPPEAVPTYITSGAERTTSIAVTRPLIPAGPILLAFISFNLVMSSCAKAVPVVKINMYTAVFFILYLVRVVAFSNVIFVLEQCFCFISSVSSLAGEININSGNPLC